MDLFTPLSIPVSNVERDHVFIKSGFSLARLDLVHPDLSGNKWFKLKYHLKKVLDGASDGLITFGGAYSNHLYAAAKACHYFGLPFVAFIRGEKPEELNKSLQEVISIAKRVIWLDRSAYREKNTTTFLEQVNGEFPNFHVVPEGGSDYLGVKGSKEIIPSLPHEYKEIALAIGSGGTTAGLLLSKKECQRIHGFLALKNGGYMRQEIKRLLLDFVPDEQAGRLVSPPHLMLYDQYHFGGFAKMTPELKSFIVNFYEYKDILLDRVYTSKMIYGLTKEIELGAINPEDSIAAMHTGGLRPWSSINDFK